MDSLTVLMCLSLQGTVLFYQPGLLYGGSVEHDCNTQRSIGYYLEALLMLAPFMKTSMKATLKGVTNDPADPTVRTHVHASDHFLTIAFWFFILLFLISFWLILAHEHWVWLKHASAKKQVSFFCIVNLWLKYMPPKSKWTLSSSDTSLHAVMCLFRSTMLHWKVSVFTDGTFAVWGSVKTY